MIGASAIGLAPVGSALGGPAPIPEVTALIAVASPLGACAAVGVHDFTGRIGTVTTRYVMDLVAPGGTVRVPISSWQATVQTEQSSYAGCVVPACAPWVSALDAATEFVISRQAVSPGGQTVEYEMVRSPLGSLQYDRGPQRYTASISGYSAGLAAVVNPPAVYDRQLSGVRSISRNGATQRVRCAVDWLLRPGHRAFVGAESFVVDYINYYVQGNDMYCDVGSRA